MKRIVLLCILHFTFYWGWVQNVSAQTEVSNFVPGCTLDGVNYFLPQTALRVTVIAEKTVTTPGELNKYAFRYLRLQNVPTTSNTSWRIQRINIEPYGMPDPQKAYNVKVKNKTIAPLVSLTNDGILLGINTQVEEAQLPALPVATPAPAPLDARKYMNQEILSAGSSAKMAELCAQEIYDIRDSRNALVRGEADNTPKDGLQLQLMLDQLATQDLALTQLFSGVRQTSTEVFCLTYIPTQETGKEILFRFSQMEGVVDSDDLSGQPIYISIQHVGNLPQHQDNLETDKKKAKMEQGIYYNVPARVAVKVFDINQNYSAIECSMGQLGYTEILSNILFDKKTTTRVTFYQENGGIKRLEN